MRQKKIKQLRKLLFPTELVQQTRPSDKRVSRGQLLRSSTEYEWKDNGINHRREQRNPSIILATCPRQYQQQAKRSFL